MNRTLLDSLTKLCNDAHNDWDEKLDSVLMAYRSAKHKTTQYSPFYLMHKWKMTLPMEVNDAVSSMDTNEAGQINQDTSDQPKNYLSPAAPTQPVELEKRIEDILSMSDSIFKDVKGNITKAQQEQKAYYDKMCTEKTDFPVS